MTNLIKIHTVGDGDALDPGSFFDAPSDSFVFSRSAASPSEQPLSPNELPAIVPDDSATPVTFASLGNQSASGTSSGPTSSDVVTFSGSGIVFNNTYAASVSAGIQERYPGGGAGYCEPLVELDHDQLKFDAQAQGQDGTLASNGFGLAGRY